MDGETGFSTKNCLSELVISHFQSLFLIIIKKLQFSISRCKVYIQLGLFGMGTQYLDSFVFTTRITKKS